MKQVACYRHPCFHQSAALTSLVLPQQQCNRRTSHLLTSILYTLCCLFLVLAAGVREVGGGADLLSHFGLETCFSLLCQQPLPPSIAESGYLASALGDAHLRRGPGMELQPLLVQAEAEGQGGAAGGVGGGLGVGAALPGDAAGAEGAPGDGLALDKALLAQAFTFRTRHRVVLPEVGST